MKIKGSLQGIGRYAKVVEGPGAVKARLTEALPLYWEKIPETQVENLWESVPGRVQAVIEAGEEVLV